MSRRPTVNLAEEWDSLGCAGNGVDVPESPTGGDILHSAATFVPSQMLDRVSVGRAIRERRDRTTDADHR